MRLRGLYTALPLVLATITGAEVYGQADGRAPEKNPAPRSIVISDQKPKDPKGTATVTFVGRSSGSIRAIGKTGKVEEISSAPITIVSPPTSLNARGGIDDADRRAGLLKAIRDSGTGPRRSIGRSMAVGDIPPPPGARSNRPSKPPPSPSKGRSQPFVIQSESVKMDPDVDSDPFE